MPFSSFSFQRIRTSFGKEANCVCLVTCTASLQRSIIKELYEQKPSHMSHYYNYFWGCSIIRTWFDHHGLTCHKPPLWKTSYCLSEQSSCDLAKLALTSICTPPKLWEFLFSRWFPLVVEIQEIIYCRKKKKSGRRKKAKKKAGI